MASVSHSASLGTLGLSSHIFTGLMSLEEGVCSPSLFVDKEVRMERGSSASHTEQATSLWHQKLDCIQQGATL